jgi:hypothetical protein
MLIASESSAFLHSTICAKRDGYRPRLDLLK